MKNSEESWRRKVSQRLQTKLYVEKIEWSEKGRERDRKRKKSLQRERKENLEKAWDNHYASESDGEETSGQVEWK